MRFVTIVAICVVSFGMVQAQQAQKANGNLVQIVALLQQHDDALKQHDLDGVMKAFAPSANTVVLGTGPGERWLGTDEIRAAYTEIFKDFDKGTSTRNCDWKTGEVLGSTAWVASM